MPAVWKPWKAKGVLSTVPTAPWKSRKSKRDSHISTAPAVLYIRQQRRLNAEELVCRGKVEIQHQDYHFPTAPTACGARKEMIAAKLRSSRRLGVLPEPNR